MNEQTKQDQIKSPSQFNKISLGQNKNQSIVKLNTPPQSVWILQDQSGIYQNSTSNFDYPTPSQHNSEIDNHTIISMISIISSKPSTLVTLPLKFPIIDKFHSQNLISKNNLNCQSFEKNQIKSVSNSQPVGNSFNSYGNQQMQDINLDYLKDESTNQKNTTYSTIICDQSINNNSSLSYPINLQKYHNDNIIENQKNRQIQSINGFNKSINEQYQKSGERNCAENVRNNNQQVIGSDLIFDQYTYREKRATFNTDKQFIDRFPSNHTPIKNNYGISNINFNSTKNNNIKITNINDMNCYENIKMNEEKSMNNYSQEKIFSYENINSNPLISDEIGKDISFLKMSDANKNESYWNIQQAGEQNTCSYSSQLNSLFTPNTATTRGDISNYYQLSSPKLNNQSYSTSTTQIANTQLPKIKVPSYFHQQNPLLINQQHSYSKKDNANQSLNSIKFSDISLSTNEKKNLCSISRSPSPQPHHIILPIKIINQDEKLNFENAINNKTFTISHEQQQQQQSISKAVKSQTIINEENRFNQFDYNKVVINNFSFSESEMLYNRDYQLSLQQLQTIQCLNSNNKIQSQDQTNEEKKQIQNKSQIKQDLDVNRSEFKIEIINNNLSTLSSKVEQPNLDFPLKINNTDGLQDDKIKNLEIFIKQCQSISNVSNIFNQFTQDDIVWPKTNKFENLISNNDLSNSKMSDLSSLYSSLNQSEFKINKTKFDILQHLFGMQETQQQSQNVVLPSSKDIFYENSSSRVINNSKNKEEQSNISQEKQESFSLLEEYNFKGQSQIQVNCKSPVLSYGENDYYFVKQLGRGNHSEVFLAQDKKTGYLFAVKQVHKGDMINQEMEEQFSNEIKIQMQLNHPNIIRMYGYHENESYFYLMMEYAPDGEIHKYQSTLPGGIFSEGEASYYLKQLASAISYLYSHNIMHRDIKPQNLLISNGIVKLADFGYSTICDYESKKKTFCGSLDYLSPQLVKGLEYNHDVDVWAFGVIVYEFLQGTTPFYEKSEEDTLDNIQNGKYSFVHPLSEDAKNFIKLLLDQDSKNRITIREICQHPWMNSNLNKYSTELGPISNQELNKIFI